MKVVRVEYTVQETYVENNKSNIRAVMEDLKENPISGMAYSAYYIGSGKFMHLNHMDSEEASTQLNSKESFIRFRTELKSSQPISPPKSEELILVGSNK